MTTNISLLLLFHNKTPPLAFIVTATGSVTLGPVEGEWVLGDDGCPGDAGGEAELGGLRPGRRNNQEGQQPPAGPLDPLSVAFSQPWVRQ